MQFSERRKKSNANLIFPNANLIAAKIFRFSTKLSIGLITELFFIAAAASTTHEDLGLACR